jgi:hypothetical protein
MSRAEAIMRWKTFALVTILLACSIPGLTAPARQFGIGMVLLDPSGLTAKAWLGRGQAVDGAVGWSEWQDHYLHVQADYLFVDRRLTGDRNLDLDGYIGVGGKLIFRDNDPAWMRVPLGLDFKFKNAPLNFFFEVAPAFNFRTVRMTGALGIRYLFGS